MNISKIFLLFLDSNELCNIEDLQYLNAPALQTL
jgi:hypothetical protein